jgi:hypothetical protein
MCMQYAGNAHYGHPVISFPLSPLTPSSSFVSGIWLTEVIDSEFLGLFPRNGYLKVGTPGRIVRRPEKSPYVKVQIDERGRTSGHKAQLSTIIHLHPLPPQRRSGRKSNPLLRDRIKRYEYIHIRLALKVRRRRMTNGLQRKEEIVRQRHSLLKCDGLHLLCSSG